MFKRPHGASCLSLFWKKCDIRHFIFFIYQEHHRIAFGELRQPLLNEWAHFVWPLFAVLGSFSFHSLKTIYRSPALSVKCKRYPKPI
jgi:hypothetical protein